MEEEVSEKMLEGSCDQPQFESPVKCHDARLARKKFDSRAVSLL
jgi:hypothetical protein